MAKKPSVAELRKRLTEFGYTEEEAQAIKKTEALKIIEEVLVNEKETEYPNFDLDDEENYIDPSLTTEIEQDILLKDCIKEDIEKDIDFDKVMEGLDIVFPEDNEPPIDECKIPTPKDPEWTDYVLADLTSDEKIKENPTTNGLRRLVEKFIGEIVESNTTILQTPSPDNEKRATVMVEIVIQTEYGQSKFSGAADVYSGNSTLPFSNHPVATAETKAEGRAYKRALKIRTSTWEELEGASSTSQKTPTEEFPQYIKEEQLNFLDILGKRLNINIVKFITLRCKLNNGDVRKLSYEQGGNLVNVLSSVQENKGDYLEEIKAECVGYNANWLQS